MNQRMVISAPLEKPIVWQISKIEPTAALGIQRITLKQDRWDPELDYIDKDDVDDKFAMYANYFLSGQAPVDEDSSSVKIHCSSNTIKCGGSYRTFTATVFTTKGKDITADVDSVKWKVTIGDIDAIEAGLVAISGEGTKIKIKFLGDRSYLTQIMHVEFSCSYKDKLMNGSTDMTIIAM